MKTNKVFLLLAILMLFVQNSFAQQPQKYRILGVEVEGVEDPNARIVAQQSSGLAVGQEIMIPGDEQISEAIRRLYRLGAYSTIEIIADKFVGEGVFLILKLKEEPLLSEYRIEGIKKSHNDEIKKTLPLLRGRPVRPDDIERAKKDIQAFYIPRGYPLVKVDATLIEKDNKRVDLVLTVDRGKRVEIKDLVINGNSEVSDRKLERKMKGTKENRWWRIWKKDTFKKDKFEEDLQNIVAYYNEKGYYDARIERDSVYLFQDKKGNYGYRVEVDVVEGPKYYLRNITWDGNTKYSDEQLSTALGFEKGDIFNTKRFEQNLYFTEAGNDVSSLYMNQGYMQFRVMPTIRQAPGDSLDIDFDLFEGEIFTFGDIDIAGNSKTKEHVIRRELETVPGEIFTRDGIRNSMLRLGQMGYFDQEKLANGLGQDIDFEKKKVNLAYTLEEVSTDQLQLSGGWGGYNIGLLLQVGVTFNNFSIQNVFNKKAWKPLPAGDGQKFSLSIQTSGRVYQNMALSFSEPWLNGRPRPFGISAFYSRYNFNAQRNIFDTSDLDSSVKNEYGTLGASVSYGRRLKWPDQFFQVSSSLGYKLYDINFTGRDEYLGLPTGKNQEVSLRAVLSRNTQFPSLFPREGSSFSLGLTVAPPLGDFIQYHKWDINTNWLLPLSEKLTFSTGVNFGFLGTLQKKQEVNFGKFSGGGDPLSSRNFDFGTDLVFMRGYDSRSIGPRGESGSVVGGRVLNKYTNELRYLLVRSQQFSLEPYVFFDAMNIWDNLRSYQPSQLYRSFGFGGRVFLPILGMVEINLGRNLDTYLNNSGATVTGKWLPQFTMGTSF